MVNHELSFPSRMTGPFGHAAFTTHPGKMQLGLFMSDHLIGLDFELNPLRKESEPRLRWKGEKGERRKGGEERGRGRREVRRSSSWISIIESGSIFPLKVPKRSGGAVRIPCRTYTQRICNSACTSTL